MMVWYTIGEENYPMKNKIGSMEILALSGKKVFTTQDLAVLWRIPERRKLIERIKYYLREHRLIHLHKGVYAYGTDYTPLDIAQKLVPLSYISLYTASQMHGLTFQYYSSIYCISLQSRRYDLEGTTYIYHKVKEAIFYTQIGLVDTGRYILADKERTICDCLYVFPGFAFDHLQGIDAEKLRTLSQIYENKRLEKDVKRIIDAIAADEPTEEQFYAR
jgi:predicted transcriptional regulator of viral defense system